MLLSYLALHRTPPSLLLVSSNCSFAYLDILQTPPAIIRMPPSNVYVTGFMFTPPVISQSASPGGLILDVILPFFPPTPFSTRFISVSQLESCADVLALP